MAGSAPWFERLLGFFSGLWTGPPAPGTHEARLEEDRAAALLDKELRKPQGQRDEELVRALRVNYRRLQLNNLQAQAAKAVCSAVLFEQPIARECCAAARWVWQRMAASLRAQVAFYHQLIEQIKEELAAAEARRPPVIVAQPALHLDLPPVLQQPPPRLDMCSVCAGWIQQMELHEQSLQLHSSFLRNQNRQRGLQPAQAAASTSQEAAGRAFAAADLPVGEARRQQQGQRQQQQGQQPGSGDSMCGGTEGGPDTPTLPPLPPTQQQQQQTQQQHASSDQEQEQRQA